MAKKQIEDPNKDINPKLESTEEKIEERVSTDEVSPDMVDDVFKKPFPDDEKMSLENNETPVKKSEAPEKKNLNELEKKEKKVRLTVLALGILIGGIISGIIFGYLYYRSGVSLCSSYNSITTSEKKLTGLIVSQKKDLNEVTNESACPTVLTVSEKVSTTSWLNYENKKYGLDFKLPADFKQDKPNTADQFFFKGPIASNPYLTVEMADAAKKTGTSNFSLESEKTGKVACKVAKISYYTDKTEKNPEKYRINVIEFTSENTPYRFEYKYQVDEGAAIVNSYLATFDLFLKTITVK